MRILALVTNAFGGIGGIAQFNRDFLTALSIHPACKEILVLPRNIRSVEMIPSKIRYFREAARGRIAYLFSLVRTVRDNPKFDLILCGHIHLLPLAFLARMFGAKGKIVLIIYGVEAWRPLRRLLIDILPPKIDVLISVSNFTRTRFMEWSKVNSVPSVILPNAIDLRLYKPGPKSQTLLERFNLKNKKVLLTLARLSAAERYKGIDEVLELMPGLVKHVPNLTYVIAGEGDDRARLEKKADVLGIRNRIVFTEFISESEKPDLYRLADAFVMPSRGEGFGIVYLEALACGVPVIASGLDATGDYLKNFPLVFLANPYRPEEIHRAILRALAIHSRTVPSELQSFSTENFERRIHEFLDFAA